MSSLEDLVEEYLDCRRKGGSLSAEDFAENYPEHKEELLDILPLLNDLETLGYQKNNVKDILPEFIDSDYKLENKIGIGGMGIVYEALQISLERKVAVKILSNTLLSDKNQREQFENEAKIIAMLHHPNIVKIFSAKCTSDCCYYAMELIDGKGLNEHKFCGIRDIAAAALQTAKAIAYAHSCKIMHRDIKPSNILIDKAGDIHVSDFGLAFLLKDKTKKFEELDTKSGTLRYMAPEKLTRGENTFQTDQYSFGVTLYEIAAGQPFLAGSPKEIANRIKAGSTPKLKTPEPDFDAIVNKCLNRNPLLRYASMDELAEDLQRFLNNEPVTARNYTPLQKYKLWKKRKPAAAFYSTVSAICAAAFVLALIIGFIQTNSALRLARKNAATADAALTKIFSYIDSQTPSESGSILLDTLMPYFQEISSQNNLPKEKLIQANKIVGLYAMRSGNYELAQKAYEKLVKIKQSAYSLNRLADADEKLGLQTEAINLRNKLIQKYSNSINTEDKLEVVHALQSFSGSTNTDYQAFGILKSLLANDRENPEYLYQYALLLANNPQMFHSQKIEGIEPNASVILKNLAIKYPDNPDYGIAIVELADRKLRYSGNIQEAQSALSLSDKLMGRFPNTPKVVSSVARLKSSYIRALRKNGDMARARKETENLLGMLELLFYNPETPESAKECLLELQLDRLEMLARIRKAGVTKDLSIKIRNELKSYNGSRSVEFRNRFLSIIQ